MTKRLTVALPDEDWDTMDARAKQHGMTIGAYAKALLLADVNDTSATTSTDPVAERLNKQAEAIRILRTDRDKMRAQIERLASETGVIL